MKRKLFCFLLAVVTCFLTSCQTKLNEPETLHAFLNDLAPAEQKDIQLLTGVSKQHYFDGIVRCPLTESSQSVIYTSPYDVV